MNTSKKPSKALHITLWVMQAFLALSFVMAGSMKAFMPLDQLAAMMAWVTSVDPIMVRIAGASELLGAVGLIVPAAFRFMPRLTGIAAAALALVVAMGAVVHLRIGEAITSNMVLFLLAAFVAWGRLMKAPIQSK
jgi:hypothetical protein